MPRFSLKKRKSKAIETLDLNRGQQDSDRVNYSTSDAWWKQLDIPSKLINSLPEKHLCVFCLSSEDCQEKFGEFLYHSFSGLRMHYFCLLLASGLSQSGESEVEDLMEVHSIYGFLIKDIVQEVKRASKLHCVYCCKRGASIGCVVPACKLKVHFTCGLDNGVLFQFYQNFKSYCSRHRPRQCLKLANSTNSLPDPENTVARRRKTKRKSSSKRSSTPSAKTTTSPCPICLDPISCSVNDFQSIKTPCCCDVWLHRSCVQQQAFSSGLYFFRCPVCNDSQAFSEEMQKMGIYVPERDASWELSHGAYHDLLQRHCQCDRPMCKCPHGRDYNLLGSQWSVVLCDLCGSSGTHVACDDTVKNETSYHACHTCVEIHTLDGARELAAQIGVIVEPRPPPRRSKRIRLLKDSEAAPTLKKPCLKRCVGNSSVQV